MLYDLFAFDDWFSLPILDRMVSMVSALLLTGKWLRAHLVTTLMLMAVLLPTYGPWLDFRFAERMPQHDHLYIGEVNLNHHAHHHTYKHVQPKVQSLRKPLALNIPAVVNLPDQDSVLRGLVQLICLHNVLTFQRIDTIGFPIVDAKHITSAIVVPPLEKPPRL